LAQVNCSSPRDQTPCVLLVQTNVSACAMPLYEEKLINPLALRFTQEHIRTTFRDGRPVEPTVEEIEVMPGIGDYDVILRAPFPHIEIIRWSPPNHGRHAAASAADSDSTMDHPDAEREHHWFTLDNRRLYCLQKVAVSLLPKRAAAVVEILYADPGAVRRKYDSETQGWSVSISHSTKCAPICRWSWQEQVLPGRIVSVADVYKAKMAMNAMVQDDTRATVGELQDVDAASSIADQLGDALRRAEAQCQSTAASVVSEPTSASPNSEEEEAGCPTPSTMDDSASEDWSAEAPTSAEATPRSRPVSAVRGSRKGARESKVAAYATAEDDTMETLRSCLEGGKWVGRRGDTYELSFIGEMCWTCVRKDNSGPKKFTVSYDAEHHIVWWGTDQAYYTDAADLAAEGTQRISWYAASDWHKQKIRFEWTNAADGRARESSTAYWAPAAKAKWSNSKVQNQVAYAEVEQPYRRKGKKYATWW